MSHMKLTEKVTGSAENMALEVYVSCQQLIWFPGFPVSACVISSTETGLN